MGLNSHENEISYQVTKNKAINRKRGRVKLTVGRQSLRTSPVAHQVRAYPSFSSMKRLGVFLLHPGWDASLSQGYPQH